MSAELSALQDLASNFNSGIFRLSPESIAVLFYGTNYWSVKRNWLSPDPTDTITDSDWDTIQAYVDQLLYEVKNPMLGLIVPFVSDDTPPNMLLCDGSTYARVDFPELYSVLSSVFIVDADNFIVPDLRGKTVIGVGSGSGLTSRSMNDSGGEESHVLDVTEIPSHDHTIPLTATTLAVEPGEVTVLTPVPLFTQSTGATGGDESHNNMPPFVALNYGIIAS